MKQCGKIDSINSLEKILYNRLKDYYKLKFNAPIKKICIDAGFTCPNRDGTKSVGGCIFCNNSGSGEQIQNRNASIQEQIEDEIKILGDGKFIAYYQNFSSTYASNDILEERYFPAIENDKIVGVSIGTRPDCINENTAALLKKLSIKKDITIELGLQTANDNTAKLINRQFDSQEFTDCVNLLNENNIKIVVHIILGLPNETEEDLVKTVRFLNSHSYHGIKIHSLYVSKGTALANMFLRGNYTPISFDDYIHQAVYTLTHINPNVIVHRLTGDGDKQTLLAPDWSKNKIKVINGINKLMHDKNLKQGMFF